MAKGTQIKTEEVDRGLAAATPVNDAEAERKRAFAEEWGLSVEDLGDAVASAEADMGTAETPPGVTEEDEARLQRFIRAWKRREYELETAKEQYKALERQIKSHLAGLEWVHGAFAKEATRRMLSEAGGKKKSLTLKFGTVGFRAKPASVEIVNDERIIEASIAGKLNVHKTTIELTDQEAAETVLSLLEMQGITPHKVNREVSKSKLNVHCLGTGEEVAGAKIIPTRDEWYLK